MSAAHRGPDAELVLLAEALCNGTLSGDQWAELERRLLADADARAYFRRHLALDAALREHGDSAAEHWLGAKRPAHEVAELASRATTSRLRSRWIKKAVLWAVAPAIAIGTFVALALFGPPSDDRGVIASLEQVTGDVRLLAASGQVRPIAAQTAIRSGDTVRTSGNQSSAVVAYPDGTRLTLVGNTSASCSDLRNKSFVIHHGTLAASVELQPRTAPMVLETPTAQAEVLGTKFVIEASAKRTDLSVTQGRVRLVRVSDGEAVDVDGGKQATVSPESKLEAEDIPKLAETWDVDFEDRLPDDWDLGEHVTQGLPKGSRGAVKAVADQQGGDTFYVIASPHAWSQGLFAVRKNSHLHMTYKMENPHWIQMILVTRTADRNGSRYCANFDFKNFPKAQARQWMTVSIPLAEFKKLHSVPESLEELVPFKLIVNSTEPDRGLVIDRIWVTPDGPGKVTSQWVW